MIVNSIKHQKPFTAMCVILFIQNSAIAQTFEETSPLDLGRVAVIKNDTQGTLTVDRFDNISHSNHFRVIIPGLAGVYTLSHAGPRTGIFFTANMRTSTLNPSNSAVESFVIDSLDYDNYQVTDATGQLLFKLGATIKTSGNGNLIFSEAQYNALVDVTFNY